MITGWIILSSASAKDTGILEVVILRKTEISSDRALLALSMPMRNPYIWLIFLITISVHSEKSAGDKITPLSYISCYVYPVTHILSYAC